MSLAPCGIVVFLKQGVDEAPGEGSAESDRAAWTITERAQPAGGIANVDDDVCLVSGHTNARLRFVTLR